MKPPTLRDRVRDSLDTGAPDAREAHADFDAILAKAKGPRPNPYRRWPLAAYAAIVIGMVIVFVVGFPTRDGPRAARGVHLYIHVEGEPEAQALSIDLDSKGDL